MHKLWLIIRREYLTRVTKRSFILATILTPVALVAFVAIVAVIFSYSKDNQKIAVKDDSGIITGAIKDTERASFQMVDDPLETLKQNFSERGFDGIVYIPALPDLSNEVRVQYFSDKQLSLTTKEFIERQLARRIRDHKIDQSGYDRKILDGFETTVTMEQREMKHGDDGGLIETDRTQSAGVATAIGSVMGFIIYIALLIYGAMIMRSVMEEKINRIVEVIISSVKPHQLMLGKIIGVSAVGVTQLLVWILLIPALQFIVGLFIPLDPASMQQANLNAAQSAEAADKVMLVLQEIRQQNWGLILPVFLLYFIGGYFIYASLFAAVGSAMGDDLGEGQALTLPITIPVILAIYIMMAAIDNPNSSLATWSSIFPLFSPIVMPARLPFNPPWWELGLSLLVLLLSCVLTVWLSSRIYRVGILMYGKKVTLKELGKWMFYKD